MNKEDLEKLSNLKVNEITTVTLKGNEIKVKALIPTEEEVGEEGVCNICVFNEYCKEHNAAIECCAFEREDEQSTYFKEI